ncbi:hypothetical protein AMTRI_Chr12g274440 [Amborella trichopoda]
MDARLKRSEALLRLLAVMFAVATAVVVATNRETEYMIIQKRATMKDLNCLEVLVMVESIAAGYQMVQLLKCILSWNSTSCCTRLAWLTLSFDQVVVYGCLGAVAAAIQGSYFAKFGARELQWSKLCNIYQRFCLHITYSLITGLCSALAMAVVSAMSAFNLFSHFSPTRPLSLKRVHK